MTTMLDSTVMLLTLPTAPKILFFPKKHFVPQKKIPSPGYNLLKFMYLGYFISDKQACLKICGIQFA